MMLRRFLCLVLSAAMLSICTAVPAFSQNAAKLPWWTSPVVRDLGLSREQGQRIREIVKSYRDRLLDARNAAAKAEADLEDVMNDPNVNQMAAQPVIERLARARANTTRIFSTMSVELRAILTEDQWRELVRRENEVRRTKRNSGTNVAP